MLLPPRIARRALQTPVTAANLRRYLDAVVEATLGAGVAAQVAAFRAGFDAIFPLDSLAALYEDEIEVMLCGECHSLPAWHGNVCMRGMRGAAPPGGVGTVQCVSRGGGSLCG